MARQHHRRTYFEDLPTLRVDDLRRAVRGRRRLGETSRFTALLPDGREVALNLVRIPGRLGGMITLAECPECGRPCYVLKVASWGSGLACVRCLQTICAVKYRSQVLQVQKPTLKLV